MSKYIITLKLNNGTKLYCVTNNIDKDQTAMTIIKCMDRLINSGSTSKESKITVDNIESIVDYDYTNISYEHSGPKSYVIIGFDVFNNYVRLSGRYNGVKTCYTNSCKRLNIQYGFASIPLVFIYDTEQIKN